MMKIATPSIALAAAITFPTSAVATGDCGGGHTTASSQQLGDVFESGVSGRVTVVVVDLLKVVEVEQDQTTRSNLVCGHRRRREQSIKLSPVR